MTKKSNKNSTSPEKKKSFRIWMIGGGVALVLVLIAAIFWFATRGEDKPDTTGNTGSSQQQTNPSEQTNIPEQNGGTVQTNPTEELNASQPTDISDPNGETEHSDPTVEPDHSNPTGEKDPPATEDTSAPVDPTATEDSSVDDPPVTEENPSDEDEYFTFGQGLSVSKISKYAGLYMEDGSNEPVSNIMMMIVRNDTAEDLQLARFDVIYSDYTAEFEVTNLPSGKSVVALEKNRRSYTEDPYLQMQIKDVVFFSEPMSLCEDRIKISGGKGYLEVENISTETLGLVYIYYKNSSDDLLYGGITYRAKLEPGLQPGGSTKILTGHYAPESCTIFQVQIVDNVTDTISQ